MKRKKKQTQTVSVRMDKYLVHLLNKAVRHANEKAGYYAHSRNGYVVAIIKKWIGSELAR